MEQPDFLFAASALPAGMVYRRDLIEPAEELELLEAMHALPFQAARYREWNARRRIVSYGGRYDFSRNELLVAEPIPRFLHPLRQRIAAWAGETAGKFTHALINEYSPGTPLGWHRDAPVFDTVVGISLAGVGRMRLRPYPPRKGRDQATVLDIAPRSAYLLRGEARWDWQHAISPARSLRYSITFRSLRNPPG
jgi:alkylated DNA repair dioxygenase AlkB